MKETVSWTSVRTLFRLEMRARFGSHTELKPKDRAMKAVNVLFTLVIYGILVAGMYFLTNMFVVRSNMRIEFLVIVTTAMMLISTAVAIGNVVKNLYMNGDNELLLRFPVNGTEILIAKSIYCFLHNFIICAMTLTPFYIVFGAVTHAGAGYYFAAFGVMLLSVFLPYFLANLLAIPAMTLINGVKNQFLIVLIILIAVICGGFVLYMQGLSSVLTYLGSEKVGIFSPEMVARYQQFANNAYPFNWYAYLLNGKAYGLTAADLGLSFLYISLLTAALGVGAFFVNKRFYFKTILKGIESEKVSFRRKTSNRPRSIFATLFHREFYLIFRSFNYSFQYLAMALAAPVMVYYCNALAASMGKKSVGAAIVPGLTLLVIIIFITIIVSFASTTISREGACFYHTKTIPVKYTTQILVKFVLYAVVATISVALCCAVVALAFGTDKAGNLLTPVDVGAIFGISEMVVLSLTCLSIWGDVKSPTFNVSGDGELVSANKNVAISLFIGILVAVIYGVFTMLFSFLPLRLGNWTVVDSVNDIYGVLAAVTAIILVASVLTLFVKLEKKYQRIIP